MKKRILVSVCVAALCGLLAALCACNNGNNGGAIAVTGLQLNPETLDLAIGEKAGISATVSPANAADKSVAWSSSNTAVAVVSGGEVTGLSEGIAVIIATTTDGGKTATCTVTVSGGEQKPTAVSLNSVTANGTAMQTTTALTLTFSEAITGLTADDIFLSGVSGVTKGALSGSGPAYTLAVSGFTQGGSLSVAVAKVGHTIGGSPKTVTIYFNGESAEPGTVSLNSVSANGSSSQTTTALTLTFSEAITGLSADDIAVSGVSGVTKGTLNGSNPYTLPVSGFTQGGTLSVTITKTGFTISGSPKTVTIYYYNNVTSGIFGDFKYTETATEVTITDYIGHGGSVTIPSTINGKPVTTIVHGSWWDDTGVFYNKNLSSVSIPSSITTIGTNAFARNQLTSVTIPNSVTTIGTQAFQHNQLTSVTIPNSVTTIGSSAFSSNQLTSVVIPNSVTTIGRWAFGGNKLTSVTIGNSVTTIGYSAFSGNQLTSVVIPNSVTEIGEWAFSSNQLTSVVIPNSVTTIGGNAFYDNQLTSVTIGNSVTTIGDSAFSGNKLTSVIIPNSVTEIGDGAFFLNQLTSVVIPNSVTTIGDGAFSYNRLTSLTFTSPSKVTTIGEQAFYGEGYYPSNGLSYGNELNSVVIPNSVKNIGEQAFCGNYLAIVTIGADVTIGDRAFDPHYALPFNSSFQYVYNTSGKLAGTYAHNPSWTYRGSSRSGDLVYTATGSAVTITCYIGPGGSVTIPSTIDGKPVTAIGEYAFDDQYLIGSVVIPNSVTTIGNQAFSGNQLTSITIGADVTLGNDAFYGPYYNPSYGGTAYWDHFGYAYNEGGKLAGRYTRPDTNSRTWTRQ